MSTSSWCGCLPALLLLLLPLVASVLPQVNYTQCIHHRSINTRKVLITTFNPTELIRPATTTCAVNCLAVNQTYEFILIHVPASSEFRNQLVCGCAFTDYALSISSKIPDAWCSLPCPSGLPTSTSSSNATCGNGRGLLSVYQMMYPSAGSVSRQIDPVFLTAVLLLFVQITRLNA